ncbi:hypothetical protein OrNV_gp070 [Oryctes rhinoceros nudivirus]|uniref:Uncharacterized protein n=1 Tax=Oryctes rhinoceros nudivirus TaxID=92521 RepID=B7SV91_9VIRU|nr:hypothetical protein OrNV_gp070 [Oryctes rhinoceros nudivirus]ACH96200.1 unknown [Oryctes rhinoceros nudivirus]QHG11305.1 hypothetical protein SI_OrNV_gp070 [Oryctes rhinoceros nudivirus]WAQ80072.1 hypothetical protein LK20_00068 [Oryctes rhinoceros nudivirus]WAQ80181.1 hypothetical protein GC_00052 [Oryctes rhinoceros nudivirus]
MNVRVYAHLYTRVLTGGDLLVPRYTPVLCAYPCTPPLDNVTDKCRYILKR